MKSNLASAFAVALLLLSTTGVHAEPVDPLPPWALTAEVDENATEVLLTWQAPAASVDVYVVYRADSVEAVFAYGVDAFEIIGQTVDPKYFDVDPPVGDGGVEGVYYVTAFVDDEESPPSNPIIVNYPHCWDVIEPFDCFVP